MVLAVDPQTPRLDHAWSDQQRTVISERVFRWWDYPIFAVLTAANLGMVVYFLAHWFSYRDWERELLPFAILSAVLFLNIAMYQLRWLTLPLMRRPRPMEARPGWTVGVATTFVPGAESIQMLEETVRALVAMDYPHETWVLDEGDDSEVKALCERLGARHFSRKNLPQYQTESGPFERRTKHGNYNAWLDAVGFQRYEIIAAFDPDHVPHRDFLLRTLGYFDDPKIGYVQAPQVYYNQEASFIARGAAEETYAYYSSIQMTSYTLGYPIVTGCHNVHRVTALRQVDGFAAHEADDLLITIHYRAAGWRGVYVPKILAEGLTPVDWSGYLTQQRRWARSVLDIKFRLFPRVAWKLPLWERLTSMAHGLYYLQGVSIGLQIALLLFMLATGTAPLVISAETVKNLLIVAIILQLCEFYRQRFFLDPRHEAGFHWRARVLGVAKWPIILAALVDAVRGRRGPYAITRKVRSVTGRSPLRLPHGLIAGLTATAWLIGMLSGRLTGTILHVAAAIVVGTSLALIVTEWLDFPDPYDASLRAARQVESDTIG